MASVLSTVLGRRVRPVPMPPWLFVKAARMQGVSAFEIGVFLTYLQDHKEGAFERGAPNTDVLDVTGAPAETFETTARRYAALPAARRSTGATLRASFDVLRTPLMPGYDLARYHRGLDAPTPPEPRFALDDPRWRVEHPVSLAEAADRGSSAARLQEVA